MMNILKVKLYTLERMEEIANHAEADYEREPENAEYEETFERAYQNEFNAFMEVCKLIVKMTDGKIDINTARQMVQTKIAELLNILAA